MKTQKKETGRALGQTAGPEAASPQIYYEDELNRIYRLGHVWLWRMMRLGKFPSSRVLSNGKRFWLKSEVDEFFLTRPTAITIISK